MEYFPYNMEFPDRHITFWIGFVLLVILLSKFLVPGLKTQLAHRSAVIEQNHTQVQKALADMQQLRGDYVSRLKDIEVEERQRIDEAVREAESVRVEIIAEAEQSANALKRRSEEEIARESTRQRILLHRQIVQTAMEAAEHSLVTHNTAQTQHQLIQDFIGRVQTDSTSAARQGGA